MLNDTSLSEFSADERSLLENLHMETAKMSWLELQPFFAKGSVLVIDRTLDLVQIAVDFSEDNADKLSQHINKNLISPPSNDLARNWYNRDETLWAVVVSPFVLVQEVKK